MIMILIPKKLEGPNKADSFPLSEPSPTFGPLCQLSRYKRMSRAQSAANAPCLPVNIAGLVAAEKQGDAGDFVGDPASEHRVQLPNLPRRPPGPRFLVRVQRHPRFDQAWTDGVATDGGAGELVTCCLHHRYDGCFGGGVVGCIEGNLIEKAMIGIIGGGVRSSEGEGGREELYLNRRWSEVRLRMLWRLWSRKAVD